MKEKSHTRFSSGIASQGLLRSAEGDAKRKNEMWPVDRSSGTQGTSAYGMRSASTKVQPANSSFPQQYVLVEVHG